MQNLNEYLYKYFSDKFTMSELLEYNKTRPNMYISSLFNSEMKKDISEREHLQKLINNLHDNELNSLSRYLCDKKINVVGLKGIFLNKYYKNQLRIFKDVDLLVFSNEFEHLRPYFVSNGYLENSFTRIRKIKKHYSLNDMNHLVLQKKFLIDKRNVFLIIELHSNLNFLCNTNFNLEFLFSNSQPSSYKNIRELSAEDNVVFLAYHAIKHLAFVSNVIEELSIGIQKFIDVYCIIKNNNVNWLKIICLALYYNATPFLYLFLYIFNDVFANIVPPSILYDLKEFACASNFQWKNVFLKVIKIAPQKLLLGDYREIKELHSAYVEIKNKYGNFDDGKNFHQKQHIWKKALLKL